MHSQPPRVRFMPTSLLGRILSALLTVALLVTGFFFLMFALIAGAVIATIVLARIWWISRKLRARRDETIIEGDYTVEATPDPRIEDRRG